MCRSDKRTCGRAEGQTAVALEGAESGVRLGESATSWSSRSAALASVCGVAAPCSPSSCGRPQRPGFVSSMSAMMRPTTVPVGAAATPGAADASVDVMLLFPLVFVARTLLQVRRTGAKEDQIGQKDTVNEKLFERGEKEEEEKKKGKDKETETETHTKGQRRSLPLPPSSSRYHFFSLRLRWRRLSGTALRGTVSS